MAQVYIGLGSNKGNRLFYINSALEKLGNIVHIEKVSSFYLTEPVEVKGGWFINCVVKASTIKSPAQLIQQLLQIEKELGRKRDNKDRKLRRTIDLDLLFYDNLIISQKGLTVPHPRLHQRRFVLVPLVEIAPELRHPLLKKTVKELLQQLEDSHEVEKIEPGNSH